MAGRKNGSTAPDVRFFSTGDLVETIRLAVVDTARRIGRVVGRSIPNERTGSSFRKTAPRDAGEQPAD